MRSCLSDQLVFDGGMQTIEGGDSFTEFVTKTESPWKQVTLLESSFDNGHAVLFYEGVDKNTDVKTRVVEYLAIRGDRIANDHGCDQSA